MLDTSAAAEGGAEKGSEQLLAERALEAIGHSVGTAFGRGARVGLFVKFCSLETAGCHEFSGYGLQILRLRCRCARPKASTATFGLTVSTFVRE